MTNPLINAALEMRVIGTAFASPAAAEAYILDGGLRSDHFTLDAHRTLWGVLVDRQSNGGSLDDVVLVDVLERNPDLLVGNIDQDALFDVLHRAVADADPDATPEHARLLRDLAERRRVRSVLERATGQVLRLDSPLTATRARIVEQMHGAADASLPQIKPVAEAAYNALGRLENPAPQPGFAFGFYGLDKVMSLRPGTVTVIAARPSLGKSLFAQQVVSHAVHHHPIRAVLVSLEMEEDELMDRIIANEANVAASWLGRQHKRKDDPEWSRVLEIGDDEALGRFGFADTVDMAVLDIEALARRHKALHPDFKLLVVDYLGLIRQTDPRQLPVHAIAEISRRLKVIAIDMKIAVVALSQLNRSNENDRRPPRLSDLRDSGAIEQDADHVLFLHADADPGLPGGQPSEPTAATEVIVAKNRSGQRGGRVKLGFRGEIPRFIDNSRPTNPTGADYYANIPMPGQNAA